MGHLARRIAATGERETTRALSGLHAGALRASLVATMPVVVVHARSSRTRWRACCTSTHRHRCSRRPVALDGLVFPLALGVLQGQQRFLEVAPSTSSVARAPRGHRGRSRGRVPPRRRSLRDARRRGRVDSLGLLLHPRDRARCWEAPACRAPHVPGQPLARHRRTLGIALLTNVDVLIVKARFTGQEAGAYARRRRSRASASSCPPRSSPCFSRGRLRVKHADKRPATSSAARSSPPPLLRPARPRVRGGRDWPRRDDVRDGVLSRRPGARAFRAGDGHVLARQRPRRLPPVTRRDALRVDRRRSGRRPVRRPRDDPIEPPRRRLDECRRRRVAARGTRDLRCLERSRPGRGVRSDASRQRGRARAFATSPSRRARLFGCTLFVCILMWPIVLHLGSTIIGSPGSDSTGSVSFFWDAHTRERLPSAREHTPHAERRALRLGRGERAQHPVVAAILPRVSRNAAVRAGRRVQPRHARRLHPLGRRDVSARALPALQPTRRRLGRWSSSIFPWHFARAEHASLTASRSPGRARARARRRARKPTWLRFGLVGLATVPAGSPPATSAAWPS